MRPSKLLTTTYLEVLEAPNGSLVRQVVPLRAKECFFWVDEVLPITNNEQSSD